jgi:hypothetical protein
MERDFPPARKVVTRAPHKTVRVINLRGIFAAPIECESSLERDFVYRAALCPTVSSIQHQPFRMTLSSGRQYTPDFLVQYLNGRRAVVEVKPADKLQQYLPAFAEVAATLDARDLPFYVLTDSSIRAEKAHRRAALVLRYRKTTPRNEDIERVRQELAARNGQGTLGDLRQCARVQTSVLLHLMAKRVATTTPALQLEPTSLITLVDTLEGLHEICLESWFGVARWSATSGGDADPQ